RLSRPRQAHPGLDAGPAPALTTRALEALRVRDAATGGHPVDLARPNRLFRAQAVTMHHFAVKQVSDGRQSDVRMRSHIDRARDSRREVDRTHVIEEHEGTHHAALREGKHASHFEAAKIAATLLNDKLDHLSSVAAILAASKRSEEHTCELQSR